MTPSTARIGDRLIPDPLWNRSEGRRANHLHAVCEVLDVIPAVSQSGVLYSVKTLGGTVRDLDAGWFLPVTR